MDILNKIELLREFYHSGKTISYNYRITQLKKLKKCIIKNEAEIEKALKLDLNKTDGEAYMTEIGIVLAEISDMISNLASYMKRKFVRTPLSLFSAKSFISPHPYGVCLILAPWNYPFQLSINPLIGAIAAGNVALIKPSAYAPNTATLLEKIISDTFDPNYIQVVTGGRDENQLLLSQKWDFIFFTGSPTVGRLVMESASKNLTPIILELGGKSPAIVTKNASIKLAAKRIAFGKILNAGQTCVAPDFAYIDESIAQEFLSHLVFYFNKFVPEGIKSPNLPKIINKKHFSRICSLLDGESFFLKPDTDPEAEKISPGIIYPCTFQSKIMQEEIFGPILPILTFTSEDEMIENLQKRNTPLALYLFTNDSKTEKKVLNQLQFGGGCINDTIVHLANNHMAFGGVGESGMGAYHGIDSFNAFSHSRSILKTSTLIDIPLRYPPYTSQKKSWLKRFLK